MHITPVAHIGALPQRQPPGPQLSARCVSHAAHAVPLVPHEVSVPGERQLVPLQQPCRHEVASHTQVLLKQRVPAPHDAPVPQRQLPLPQLLATVVSQAAQLLPRVPH